MKVTIFRSVKELTTPSYVQLSEIAERIKRNNTPAQIWDKDFSGKDIYPAREITKAELLQMIIAAPDKGVAGELKRGLPSILFAGDFPNRNKGALPLQHSGLIVLDVDNLESDELERVKEVVKNDPHTVLSFVSPSGNGYKIVVRIPADTQRHVGYFLALESYYFVKYKITIDPSGKNIGRVCYESYDPDVYYNDMAQPFVEYVEQIKNSTTRKNPIIAITAITDDTEKIDRVVKWWGKNYTFSSGGRNNAMYQLAAAFNRFGVAEGNALNYCLQYAEQGFTETEITTTVKSSYRAHREQHGCEVFEDTKIKKIIEDNISILEESEAIAFLQEYEELDGFSATDLAGIIEETKEEIKEKNIKRKNSRQFWVYDDGKLKIENKDLITFINDLGYWMYRRSQSPKDIDYIHIDNNIIRVVDEIEIRHKVLEFVESKKQNAVYNKLTDSNKYFCSSFLSALPIIKPPILKDREHTSFVPTTNGVYRITSQGVNFTSYIDLTDGYVWESQLPKRAYEYINIGATDTPFAKYVECLAGNAIKFSRLRSIIGYLLHNFKDPANSKAVFLFDSNISQVNGEPEGGSGKSLLIEGLKRIREVANIPGDRIDFKKSFNFQEVKISTQIAWVDELERNADISNFFSRITNGMPIEKKQKDPIFIEQEDAPKFVFTTNYMPKGSSGSHIRRRIDFAVSNFFNVSNTPKMMFGKSFFLQWDNFEHNAFFSFCLDCIAFYLKNGIIEVIDENDLILQAINECGKAIFDYWFTDGNFELAKVKGYIHISDNYRTYMEGYEEKYTEKKVSLFLRNTKKILSLYKINTKEDGKGQNLRLIFT